MSISGQIFQRTFVVFLVLNVLCSCGCYRQDSVCL